LAGLGTAYEGEQLGLLEEAARLAPQDPDATTELGVYLLQHGHPGRALEQFQRVIELETATPQALANRGAALYLLGRVDEAARDFEAALVQDPCNFDARNNLILVRRTAGDTDAVRRLAVIPEGCRFSTKQQVALDAAQP
jgi:Flp pilus assembly protein TadD